MFLSDLNVVILSAATVPGILFGMALVKILLFGGGH